MEYTKLKTFLDKNNLTHEQMDMMWNYCIEHNHKLICQLHASGKSWTDLNLCALGTLEPVYNKLKQLEENK